MIKNAIKEAILDGEISNDFEAAYTLMLEEGKTLGLTVNQELKRGKD
jgi:poly(A) polymerase